MQLKNENWVSVLLYMNAKFYKRCVPNHVTKGQYFHVCLPSAHMLMG